MKEILQKLDKLSTARPLEIIRKKKEGSKVVEFFGDFVPEQWITAAGAESYLIMKGGDPQPPEATLDYMLRFMNPLAASMAGSYLLGLDAVMPIADSVTIQQHDSHYGRMTEILEYKGLPVVSGARNAARSISREISWRTSSPLPSRCLRASEF